MSQDRFASRRQKVLSALKASGVQALLVTNFTNVSYLTGFSGDDSYLLVGRGCTVLISDGRYTTQIAQECPDIDAVIRDQKTTLTSTTGEVVKKAGFNKVGIESGSVTVAELERLKEAIKAAELVPLAGVVEELRLVKDAYEITAIRQAVRQAEKGFAALKATLRGGQTELEVAHDLEHVMRRHGASGASFPPIIAVGERAALPHGRPTDKRIDEADFVLVDWGANGPGGYKSDLTRVLVTGKIATKLERLYKVVLSSQLAGIAAIRPGARCCDVDATARQVIVDAGYSKHFNHGLGHGIGLDIHEGPRLNATTQTELRPGMIVTVEPGLYFEGWGGIRIEDDILVTRSGYEVLTSVPKEFEQSVIS